MPSAAPPSRPLTAAETALAQSVFGASVDYARVRIHDGPFTPLHPAGVGMAPDGNLYMYGCFKPDYAAEAPQWQALFIHEMTHVWQFQNKILQPVLAAAELAMKHRFNYAAAYDYVLDAGKDLLDYNMEQQASIVEDYFATVLKQADHAGHCRNRLPQAEKAALFKKVLEKFLKNPAYARRDAFPPLLRKKPGPEK